MNAPPDRPAPSSRPALWITLFLLGTYLLTTGGRPFISDGELMLLSATRLIDAQTLALPESAAAFPQTVRGADGFLYSRYGLGQPLLAALLYWFGRYVVGWYVLPTPHDFTLGKFFALLLPALATAGTGGILCTWATRLYGAHRTGILLALLYGTATLAFPYSRFFFLSRSLPPVSPFPPMPSIAAGPYGPDWPPVTPSPRASEAWPCCRPSCSMPGSAGAASHQ